MKKSILFLLLIGASLAGQAQKNVEEAKAAIAAARLDFQKMFNADDAIKTAYYYSNRALFMPPNQAKVSGRAAVKEYYKSFAQVYSDYAASTNTLVVDNKMAYETGSYIITVLIPGATETYVDRGKYLCIWQREDDGKWKILYDIYNTDLPPSK